MIDFVNVGSIIADIIVILIFILSISHAYRRGLTILIYQFISLIITFVVLLILCKPITNLVVQNTGLDEFFVTKIQSTLENTFEENFKEGTLIDTDNTNISNTVVNMINKYITEAKENSTDNIANFVANEISYIVVSAIVVIILGITIRLLLILLKFCLITLSNLPIINTLDKSGGIVYGIFRAYLITYIILAILSLLSPMLANTGLTAFIKSSRICSIF